MVIYYNTISSTMRTTPLCTPYLIGLVFFWLCVGLADKAASSVSNRTKGWIDRSLKNTGRVLTDLEHRIDMCNKFYTMICVLFLLDVPLPGFDGFERLWPQSLIAFDLLFVYLVIVSCVATIIAVVAQFTTHPVVQ